MKNMEMDSEGSTSSSQVLVSSSVVGVTVVDSVTLVSASPRDVGVLRVCVCEMCKYTAGGIHLFEISQLILV